MDVLLIATVAVAIAEIGDKTQLLSLILAARFDRPWTILAGIVAATVANHALAGAAGEAVSRLLGPEPLRYALAVSFILMGLWMLRPDEVDEPGRQRGQRGVFATTAALFFLAEMGDKTQVATVALAAGYDPLWAVVVGTTGGMVLANAPMVFGGEWLMRRIPLRWIRRLAALLFVVLGLLTLVPSLS